MNQRLIKIFLVDDHTVVRMGIRSIFERHENFIVCGEADSLNETYDKIKELKPDVILLDWKLPDGNGMEGCINIKNIIPNVKIVILTAYSQEHIVLDTIKAGADGYLLKNIDSRTIVKAAQDVYSGRSVLDAAVTEILINKVTDKNQNNNFSQQEKQILELLSIGRTNREIGKELELAEKTVRNYVSRLMKKIGVTNRTEAAIFWSQNKK